MLLSRTTFRIQTNSVDPDQTAPRSDPHFLQKRVVKKPVDDSQQMTFCGD